MTNKFPPIVVTRMREIANTDDYEFEFDMSNEFVEWFKETQQLSRWSQARFKKWAASNIDAIVEIQLAAGNAS